MLYRGLVLALRFNLRPTRPDLHSLTGGIRLTKGICENSDQIPQIVMNTSLAGDMHFLLERRGVLCDDTENGATNTVISYIVG